MKVDELGVPLVLETPIWFFFTPKNEGNNGFPWSIILLSHERDHEIKLFKQINELATKYSGTPQKFDQASHWLNEEYRLGGWDI